MNDGRGIRLQIQAGNLVGMTRASLANQLAFEALLEQWFIDQALHGTTLSALAVRTHSLNSFGRDPAGCVLVGGRTAVKGRGDSCCGCG